MKLTLLARRLSVSAPRMTVRRHVPWPVRLALVGAALATGAIAAIAGWQALLGDPGRERDVLHDEVVSLRERLALETAERQRLSSIANAAGSQLKVEAAAGERLASQLRSLEADNARLRADLAYLESLLPAAGAEGAVAIRRLNVEPDGAPNRMRYKALITQGGRSDQLFDGTLELLITTVVAGKATAQPVALRSDGQDRAAMRLTFRRYQRLEGLFDVPAGATVRSVQLRVLSGGVVRAQQSVTL